MSGSGYLDILNTCLLAVSSLSTFALTIIAWWQLGGLRQQNRLQGRREQQWRTLEICSRLESDPMLEANMLSIWNNSAGGINYNNVHLVKRDVINFLNYLDSIAIGVEQGLYIEEIVRDHMEPIYLKADKEFLGSKAREIGIELHDFEKLQDLIARWKKAPTRFNKTKEETS